MQKLLRKRWRGVPMGALIAVLALCLVTGSVFAYTVIGGTVNVGVEEAITVHYDWVGNATWVEVSDGFDLTITGAYPGETADIGLKFVNVSSAPLTITGTALETVWPTGGEGKLTISGGGDLFGTGEVVPGDGELIIYFQGEVAGDAPPGTYTMFLSFARS